MSKKTGHFKSLVTCGLALLLIPGLVAKKNPAAGLSGRDIYMDRCGACHGEDGTGNGPAVGALRIMPPDLTLLAQRSGGTFPTVRVKNLLGEPVNITAHGSREMPIWGELFGAKNAQEQQEANERFKALASYLESIQQ